MKFPFNKTDTVNIPNNPVVLIVNPSNCGGVGGNMLTQ